MSRHQPAETCSNRSSCRILQQPQQASGSCSVCQRRRCATLSQVLTHRPNLTSKRLQTGGDTRTSSSAETSSQSAPNVSVARNMPANLSQNIMNYDDDIRKDLRVGARGLRKTAQKHRDTCSGWPRFRRENDMRMEVSYSYTAMKGICKASSCAVGSPMSAGRKI